jgi:hypothetical protein
MNTIEFLSCHHSLDIKLWPEGCRLRCRVPDHAAMPELHAQLTGRREEIIRIPGAVRLSGLLDTPTLKRTLDKIALRHESLRKNLAEDGSEYPGETRMSPLKEPQRHREHREKQRLH